MKIVKILSNNKNHFGGGNSKKYITIHQTGNTKKGVGARNHASFMNSGSSSTWHFTVDDKEVIQHFNEDVKCWHSGDGRGSGNTQSIGIELCVNSDGNYLKTIENGILLVRHLMGKFDIPISNIKQHNHWSGKDCPSDIRRGRSGVNWNSFINKVVNTTPTVKPPVTSNIDDLAIRTIRGEFGNGIERKKKLGSNYLKVQKRVNEMLK